MISSPTLREYLAEAPFTLTMSSGFFGFFAHAGVLRELIDAGLHPAKVTGSSAGALVLGSFAGGLSPDALIAELEQLRREHFWDPAFGPGLLRGALFRTRLDRMLKVRTFEESKVDAAFSTFDLGTRSTRVLSQGDLALAIHASCAVPLMFHPVRHENRWLLDGGLLDRSGLAAVEPGERVFFHHLASRSPWRTAKGMGIPVRPDMVSLVVPNLVRLGPYRLQLGMEALTMAARATRQALDRSIKDRVLTIPG